MKKTPLRAGTWAEYQPRILSGLPVTCRAMPRRTYRGRIAVLLMVAMLASGCADIPELQPTQPPISITIYSLTVTPTATEIPPTATAVPPSPTPLPPSPTPVPPTPTQVAPPPRNRRQQKQPRPQRRRLPEQRRLSSPTRGPDYAPIPSVS